MAIRPSNFCFKPVPTFPGFKFLFNRKKLQRLQKQEVERLQSQEAKTFFHKLALAGLGASLAGLGALGIGTCLYFSGDRCQLLLPYMNLGTLTAGVQKVRQVGLFKLMGVYNMVDVGLANFLGMRVLRHGTNPYSYLKISLQGADPSYGGGKFSTYSFCKNSFYVMSDYTLAKSSMLTQIKFDWWASSVNKDYVCRNVLTNLQKLSISYALSKKLARWYSLVAPILRFKYETEEVKNWFNISSRQRAALYTRFPLSASRLGIMGSIIYGLTSKTPKRMYQNKSRVALGAMQLFVAYYVLNYFSLAIMQEKVLYYAPYVWSYFKSFSSILVRNALSQLVV